MRLGKRTASLVMLTVAVGMLASGCWLRLLYSELTIYEDYTGYGESASQHDASLWADGDVALCGDVDGFVECQYSLGGLPFTSTFQLIAELGAFGLLIDPVILQVPIDSVSFSGTVRAGNNDLPLIITATESFDVEPGRKVQAEAGHKFLIVELPPDVAGAVNGTDPENGLPLSFHLNFMSGSPSAFTLKAMMTVKVEVDGKPYYLPTFPCTTDFASIPSYTAPVSLHHDLLPPLADLFDDPAGEACNGEVYDLRTIPAGGRVVLPALSTD